MQLQALSQRGDLDGFLVFVEICLDSRRRHGSGGSEKVFENPLAARHRRSSITNRGHSQNAALTQKAAARAGCIEGDAAKVAPANIGYPVVTCQPLIHEGVVGIEHTTMLRSSRTMLSKSISVSRLNACRRFSSKSFAAVSTLESSRR